MQTHIKQEDSAMKRKLATLLVLLVAVCWVITAQADIAVPTSLFQMPMHNTSFSMDIVPEIVSVEATDDQVVVTMSDDPFAVAPKGFRVTMTAFLDRGRIRLGDEGTSQDGNVFTFDLSSDTTLRYVEVRASYSSYTDSSTTSIVRTSAGDAYISVVGEHTPKQTYNYADGRITSIAISDENRADTRDVTYYFDGDGLLTGYEVAGEEGMKTASDTEVPAAKQEYLAKAEAARDAARVAAPKTVSELPELLFGLDDIPDIVSAKEKDGVVTVTLSGDLYALKADDLFPYVAAQVRVGYYLDYVDESGERHNESADWYNVKSVDEGVTQDGNVFTFVLPENAFYTSASVDIIASSYWETPNFDITWHGNIPNDVSGIIGEYVYLHKDNAGAYYGNGMVAQRIGNTGFSYVAIDGSIVTAVMSTPDGAQFGWYLDQKTGKLQNYKVIAPASTGSGNTLTLSRDSDDTTTQAQFNDRTEKRSYYWTPDSGWYYKTNEGTVSCDTPEGCPDPVTYTP